MGVGSIVKMRHILCCAIAFVLLATGGIARQMRQWTPESLVGESSYVCNGLVLRVAPNGETSNKWDISTIGYSAEIKVLKSLKGNPISNLIVVRYFHTDPNRYSNGPEEICLEQGKRYRFYLSKDDNNPFYVPCRATGVDDGDSVELMSDKEPDDNKPYTEANVIELAGKYVESNLPGSFIDTNSALAAYKKLLCEFIGHEHETPVWTVQFERRNPKSASQTNHVSLADGPGVKVRISSDGSVRILKDKEPLYP